MPGAITEGSKTPNVRAADSSMLSSAGDGESAVSPKAKKRSWNTVARAAAFRQRREHDCRDAGGRVMPGAITEGSETPV
jgi:hypothetical protein